MGQSTLKSGKFFICGPITNLAQAEKDHMECEVALNRLQLIPVNQFFLFHPQNLQDMIKRTVMHLLECNTVVTLHNWEDCHHAKKQVEVARILELDVIDFTKLIHLKSKENVNS